MRLTTLARKIDKTPSQLITYLAEKNIEIPNGIHSKLEKEVVDAVLDEFLPDEQELIAEDEVISEEIPEQEDLPKEKLDENVEEEPTMEEVPVAEESNSDEVVISEKPKTATIEDLESEHFEEVDLIKVKKVKLEGIKVVGKIDLPEKPKKVEVEEPKEEIEKTEIKKESSKFQRNRKKNKNTKIRKSPSYEDRLKEEEREKLKQRRRRENAERKRKQKFYDENIKPKHVQKKKSKKQQTPIEKHPIAEKEVIVHKNPIKRLWAWLNGKYDKY